MDALLQVKDSVGLRMLVVAGAGLGNRDPRAVADLVFGGGPNAELCMAIPSA